MNKDIKNLTISKIFSQLVKKSGISYTDFEKQAGVHKILIKSLEEDGNATISFPCTLKLAKFFKLELEEIAQKWANENLENMLNELKRIKPYTKFLTYRLCEDKCQECSEPILTFIVKQPKYYKDYTATCPHCGKETKAIKTKVKLVKELPNGAIEAFEK